ncbi:MAG: hypothetical protein P8Z79_15555, partial [Sedimentisphaerales bacterium]
MKAKTLKIAAAAVVIIAVLVGIHGIPWGHSVAWADVIQPILNARTASLDIHIGSPGGEVVIHDDVMGSRIHRTVSNTPDADIVIDFRQQRLLTIHHSTKT